MCVRFIIPECHICRLRQNNDGCYKVNPMETKPYRISNGCYIFNPKPCPIWICSPKCFTVFNYDCDNYKFIKEFEKHFLCRID